MARKTDGEKIDELEKVVAAILEQIREIGKVVDALGKAGADNRESVLDFRLRCEREFVGLNTGIGELRRWTEMNGTAELKVDIGVLKEKSSKVEASQEKIGTRAWSVVPNILGALVSGAIAAIVAYFVANYGK